MDTVSDPIIDLVPPPLLFEGEAGVATNTTVEASYVDGRHESGRLVRFDRLYKEIDVQPVNGSKVSISLNKLKFLKFAPYSPAGQPIYPGSKSPGSILLPEGQRDFEIEFDDNDKLVGQSYCYLVDDLGLHLFTVADADSIRRMFVPLNHVKKYRIGPYLGQYLQESNFITSEQLDSALQIQKNMLPTALDNSAALKSYLQTTRSSDTRQMPVTARIGEILQQQGYVSDEEVHKALAVKLGLPFVRLREFDIDVHVMDFLTSDIAHRYKVVPLMLLNQRLVLAMDDPLNAEALNMVGFLSGLTPEIVVSSLEDIEWALNNFYSPLRDAPKLEESQEKSQDKDALTREARRLGEEKPIVRLVNNILSEAMRRRASDIHIRPEEHSVALIFRIDGSLIKVREFNKNLLQAMVSRIKILGRMDIAQRNIPQDGQTRVIDGDNIVDMRISMIPTVNGESIVIRLLSTRSGMRDLGSLNLNKKDYEAVQQLLNKMHGLILVTGPTGSGKSTTLYAALHEIRKQNLNIITVEDPVEYHIEGIEQVQIDMAQHLTFARVLRNILRHDPDVVMIGEIRDEETAHIAVQSSLTGHLVLSTLHTNSAAGAITRMLDMGIEPYLLAPTLLCVVAQRLMRSNCTECLIEDDVEAGILAALGLTTTEKFYRGAGCNHCNMTGFSGREAVYEVLTFPPEIRDAVKISASERDIQAIARKKGMKNLTQNAIEKARNKRVPLSEVYKIAQD